MFKLCGILSANNLALVAKTAYSINLWHRRLAHLNCSDMEKMKNGGVFGISYMGEDISACVACCKGKQSRTPFQIVDPEPSNY